MKCATSEKYGVFPTLIYFLIGNAADVFKTQQLILKKPLCSTRNPPSINNWKFYFILYILTL